MKKRVILLVALVLVACCLVPLFVGCDEAAPTVTQDGLWQYTLNDQGQATLTLYLGEEANVSIPSQIAYMDGADSKTASVIAIGDACFMKYDDGKGKWRNRDTYTSNTTLKSVVIQEGIESIGNMAFYLCSSLESVTLPESLKSVGDFAFFGCSALTEISFPKNVTNIGAYSFRACASLVKVEVLAVDALPDLGDKAFYLVNEKSSKDDQYYINSALKFYVPAEALSLYNPDAIEAERRQTKLNNHRYWSEYIKAGCFPQLADQ